MKIKENSVYKGDCLEVMSNIEDKSIDFILCDLPYGITNNNWDKVINIKELFKQYNRIIKDKGIICLTAVPPFSSELIIENKKNYKYSWYWEKSTPVGFLNAKKKPLKIIEEILIFYKNLGVYNPQKNKGKPYVTRRGKLGDNYGSVKGNYVNKNSGWRYPKNLLQVNSVQKTLHPTQKPIELFEYLIKTYTSPGNLVLDNCAGSGTTAIACRNLDRKYILIEKEEKYIEIIKNRIKSHKIQKTFDFL